MAFVYLILTESDHKDPWHAIIRHFDEVQIFVWDYKAGF